MEIRILKPRKALNKAFLKVKPNRSEIECFKTNLSQLLDRINEKFGTNFTEMDKVLLQIENDIRAEASLINFAQNNDERVFRPVFEKVFKDMAILRYEQNDEFFVRMFNDSTFMAYTMDLMCSDIYRKIKTAEV